jgi:alanine-synthesizing transaminase
LCHLFIYYLTIYNLTIRDDLFVPAPDYPLWTAAVTLSGGRPVHYICDEQADWYPDLDDIKAKITPRTRGIVLINPNNPTGARV